MARGRATAVGSGRPWVVVGDAVHHLSLSRGIEKVTPIKT
jgi:hypothetical protein